MEIKLFTKVFCTEDYEDNNTGGKIGTVLEKTSDDVARYLVDFPRGKCFTLKYSLAKNT